MLSDASWCIEAAYELLWSLGYDKDKGFVLPVEQCDPKSVIALVPCVDKSVPTFIAKAELRRTSEILDALDLIYNVHWAIRQAQIDGEAPPLGLDYEIVMEHHKALNWLTRYEDNWDEVTTDT